MASKKETTAQPMVTVSAPSPELTFREFALMKPASLTMLAGFEASLNGDTGPKPLSTWKNLLADYARKPIK